MAMRWKCVLDSAQVLIDYEQIDADSASPEDVLFDDKPDLVIGKYRWNGETFVPAQGTELYRPDGPDPWYAMYRFMMQEAKKRKAQSLPQIPQPCLVWLDYFRRSFTTDDPV